MRSIDCSRDPRGNSFMGKRNTDVRKNDRGGRAPDVERAKRNGRKAGK